MKTPPLIPGWLLLATFVATGLAMCVTLQGCATLDTERPRLVAVATGPESGVMVRVYPDSCYGTHTGAYATVSLPAIPTVYLCGHASDERHELAHWAGFRHGPWDEKEHFACAEILASGYQTPYPVGRKVCMMKHSRFEWIE